MNRLFLLLILLSCISCAPTREIWVHRLPNYSAEPLEMNNDSMQCKVCGHKIVPILYGLPSDIGFKKAKRGDFLLGGCMPSWEEEDDNGEKTYIPDSGYACSSCGQQYYTKD